MKKLLVSFVLLMMSQMSFAIGLMYDQQEKNNKANDFVAIQTASLVPTNASWWMLQTTKTLRLTNGNGVIECLKGWKTFSDECDGEAKQYTIESYVKLKYGNVKVLGMTPHFDRDGNFQFLIIYFIQQGK